MPARPRLTRAAREGAVFAACLALAMVYTWPLLRLFTTHICGDPGDPYQTLWGMRWIRDALLSLRNPFFTDRVFHPSGATLVFQTFDLPSALAMVPLWGLVPEVAIYNTAVLLALTLTAYGMFRLIDDLTGDALVAFATAALFTAVPYQFAHLQGHLHLLAMGWVPLYLMYLLRLVRGCGTVRDGVLGGLFLALAALASWYHVVYAAVLTPVLFVYGFVEGGRARPSAATFRAVLALGGTWLVLVGPLIAAMLVVRAREDITGAHDAVTLSADVYSFVYPNAAQRWSGAFGAQFQHWSGNTTENATYVGFTLLGLAAIGAVTSRLARAFFVAAILGAVLALGPRLHVDGRVFATTLPYGYLERALPLLSFMGVPIRFGYVMYLGLAVAAGLALARLRSVAGRAGRWVGGLAVVVPVALGLAEYWPRDLITSAYAVPAPMRAWADLPATFAVLDVWDWYRPMWHATIHRKPLIGGYLSRVPKRLEDPIYRHPVLRSILEGGGSHVVQRRDPRIDFAWGAASPDGALLPDDFYVRWSGTLLAPASGRYDLWLEADDAALVQLDARLVLRAAGCAAGEPCTAHATVELTAGPHAFEASYRERRGNAEVRLAWQPPGGVRTVVPTSALRTVAGTSGLDAEYEQTVPARSGIGRDAGRAALRALGVRYVVLGARPNACVEEELALPLSHSDGDVRIFTVPPS